MAMTDKEFDAFVDNLQDKIFTEAEEAYGPKGFERWRNPKYCGQLADADTSARITGTCGDTIEMFLKIEDGRITDGSYTTTGCGSSGLCGSFTVELIIGKNLEDAFNLQGADVLQHIGTFPDDDSHCAFLAVETLQEALNSYMVKLTREEKKG